MGEEGVFVPLNEAQIILRVKRERAREREREREREKFIDNQ